MLGVGGGGGLEVVWETPALGGGEVAVTAQGGVRLLHEVAVGVVGVDDGAVPVRAAGRAGEGEGARLPRLLSPAKTTPDSKDSTRQVSQFKSWKK